VRPPASDAYAPEEPRPVRRPGDGDDSRFAREPRGLPIGLGALLGVAGLVCVVLGIAVLPWFTAAGEDVTLADLRDAFTVPETDPDDLPGAGEADATTPQDGLPAPAEVGEAVEQQARDAAAGAAATALDSGKARYLELYTESLWIAVIAGLGLAVVLSTIVAPRSFALSWLTGFRVFAGLVVVAAAAAHGIALWIVFTGDGAPDPVLGVWLGVGGIAAVLLACLVGPKRAG
jgi:hypothetical protein